MDNVNQPFEQRQYTRFQVPASAAYAVVKRPWPRSPVIGGILDISMGGLAFEYVAKEKETTPSSQLDILFTDGTFHLDELSLKTISDLETESPAPVGFASRRCHVQFKNLTDDQMLGIMYLIQTHTMADPES